MYKINQEVNQLGIQLFNVFFTILKNMDLILEVRGDGGYPFVYIFLLLIDE